MASNTATVGRHRSQTESKLIFLSIAAALSALLFAAILGSLEGFGQAATEASEAKQIEQKLPRLRHLTFKSPVRYDVETPEQVRKRILDEARKERTDEEFRNDSVSGAMVGLWPAGYDLKNESAKLLAQNLAGFYDPHSKRMFLVRGEDSAVSRTVISGAAPSHDYIEEMVIAHELTHALQDQYFDLSSLERIKNDDDRELAARAVVEGDATLTGLYYTFKDLNADRARSALTQLYAAGIQPREWVSVPDTVKMDLQFPYVAGLRFMAVAFKRGGWKAVNEVLRKPPISTHQIINPELYFDRATPPQQITIRGYQRALADWRKIDDNTMGQAMLQALLHQNLGDDEHGFTFCNQWTGDRFLILGKGDVLTVLGFIAFSDAGSAGEFAMRYSRILDMIHGARLAHVVDRRDDKVMLLLGESAARAPSMVDSLWAATQFGGRPDAAAPAQLKVPGRDHGHQGQSAALSHS